jgi:uncharacterized membrane protein YbhN (UPF0104 family)
MLFAAALFAIEREFAHFRWHDITTAVEEIAVERLVLAVALMGASHLLLTLQPHDPLGARGLR